MIRIARFFPIDSADEANEDSDKFTKVLETPSHTVTDSFLVSNVVELIWFIYQFVSKEKNS